ncbi:imidazoleglycerol-phosphate dehydratase HisB [uncultured Slackia sp.]|uniref:imidazoleglycerol-phosphate dehydratase HisB n=1 Tax=uncultured Slackia sp. TaxID=665903 RepID=UPI0025E6DED3|nr:imidazoleglycerol-phosphate dehydratase HisB [uncultured Slackia sp.]
MVEQGCRMADCMRETSETTIRVMLNLDDASERSIETGVGFFDHMLDAFARHGKIGLDAKVIKGDLHVDAHHTVEDTGIVLGCAVAQALGDKAGIRRFGHAFVPMDEALVMAAVDISGRGQAFYEVPVGVERVGDFDTQLAKEFFIAFAREAGITLHVRLICGENGHHIIEAAFKAVGRALREAVEVDPRETGIPSTKGCL